MYLVKIRLVLQQRLYHARLVEFCGEVEGRIAVLVLNVDVGKNVTDHGYKLEYIHDLNCTKQNTGFAQNFPMTICIKGRIPTPVPSTDTE